MINIVAILVLAAAAITYGVVSSADRVQYANETQKFEYRCKASGGQPYRSAEGIDRCSYFKMK